MHETYRICWTLEQWTEALKEAAESPRVGLDFETCPDPRRETTTEPTRPEDGAKVAGTALAWLAEDGVTIKSAYAPCRHHRLYAGGMQMRPREVFGPLSDFMRNRPADQLVVVHNLSFELGFLLAEGVLWPKRGQLHDTMIAARVLNKGVGFRELIGLKGLQAEYLNRDMTSKNDMDTWLKAHNFKPGRDIWKAPPAIAGVYAQDDARDTLAIWLMWEEYVYQEPTQWWWHRGPDRRFRHDLYELEIEAAINAIINCLRGTRYDKALCARQALAAETLQEVSRRWVRNYLEMPTINPGSGPQVRGIIFSEAFGVQPSLEHMTDSFNKLPDREQVKTIEGLGKKTLKDYASLDIDALGFYAEQVPEHESLFFMLAVYRKCQTAINWFNDRVLQFGTPVAADPWWDGNGSALAVIFHRLLTVGTVSGRMSSRDYNGQQVPKRFKMLLNANKLHAILREYLPENQFEELLDMFEYAPVNEGDEAKVLGLEPGEPVIDFSVRRMFITRPDHVMRLWDLSQVEMRGFAHYSGNALLCNGYGSPPSDEEITDELSMIYEVVDGRDPHMALAQAYLMRHADLEANPFDIHAFVSDELDINRKKGKGINFGIVYGMGKRKLARQLGWTIVEGREYLARYYAKFPEIQTIQMHIKQRLRERGYVFDPFGRRYFLPMNRSYVGLNRLIQGWAATVMKVGFVRISELFASPALGGGSVHPVMGRRTPDECRGLKIVHDEIIAEVLHKHNTQNLDFMVRSCMTLMHGLNVPLGTSSEMSDRSWDEAIKYEVKTGRAA